MKYFSNLAVLFVVCLLGGSAHGQSSTPFDIVINFTGDSQFQEVFDNAAAIWESILPSRIGTTPDSIFNTLTIDASVVAGEPGGVLASAGPTFGGTQGGFFYSTVGSATFDSEDIETLSAGGSFEAVVLHEIGHVLGFGTLWDLNNVFEDNSSGTAVGQYVGTNGVARYNEEFGLDEDFIPIENNGGEGTADGHFDEETFGLELNSDPTVNAGLRFGPNSGELLTGFLNGDIFISDTTGGTFEDIGFEVDFDAIAAFNGVAAGSGSASVPEPGSAAVLLVAMTGMVGIRRRK